MHINHCSKCGKEFETKNPKRIVCPNCLYLDRAAAPSVAPIKKPEPQPSGGGYGGPPRQGFSRPPGGGPGGGRPPQYGGGGPMQPQRPRGFGGPPRGRGGPPGGGRGPGGRGPGGRGPGGRGGPAAPRKLLVPKEALMEIEKRYKTMLPLPNPDAHVVIAEALNMEPNKVFFGINLIRQKMRLPKLEYPKRPLAVTQDQLMAIKALYEPFLPVPPIGIHKILAKQLKMDEWRVHVAIGLIRKQMAMPRWNEERDDLPPQMKEQLAAMQAASTDGEGNKASTEEAAPKKASKSKSKE